MKHIAKIAGLLLAAFALQSSACRLGSSASTPSTASGQVKAHHENDLRDFNKIDAGSVFDIHFAQGNTFKVNFKGDAELIDAVHARVDDNCLCLELNRKGLGLTKNNKTVQVFVTAPSLNELELSGAAKFSASKLNVQDLELDLSGASNVEITNINCQKFDLDASGAAQFNGMVTARGKVKIDNSGAAKVRGKYWGATIELENSGAANLNITAEAQEVRMENTGGASLKAKVDCLFLVAEGSGASSTTLSGKAASQKLRTSGVGRIDARQLSK